MPSQPPCSPLASSTPARLSGRRGPGRREPGRLLRDPASAPSIPSQTRPDKSSSKFFRKLPPLLELSVRAGTLSSCETVGFFSQEPCLDAEMEPSVAAFLNSEIRWTLKDFRTLRHFGCGAGQLRGRPVHASARRAPCGPSGASGLQAEPAQVFRRRVF